MKINLLALLAALMSCYAATAAASEAAKASLHRLEPLKMIGSAEWGKDGYFRLKWKHSASERFLDVDVLPDRRQVWVASVGYPADDIKLTVLDAHGETVDRTQLHTGFKSFKLIDMGKKDPLVIVWDDRQLRCFDKAGSLKWDFSPPKSSPSDYAVVPPSAGGPLLVASYQYGDAGLRAVGADGKLAWQAPEVPRAGWISTARLDGKTLIAATDGVGKTYLADLKGRIVERISSEGNSDRVLFDGSDRKDQRMYILDSGFDSWRQRISVAHSTGSVKKEGSRWEGSPSEDLGRITVTAYTLGDFDGPGRRQPVLGTDNGWVLLLDQAGKVVSETRLRGKISYLGALDLSGDGKDELVVGVEGYSGNVLVFTRPSP